MDEEGNDFRIRVSFLAACRTHGVSQLGKIFAKKVYEMEKMDMHAEDETGSSLLIERDKRCKRVRARWSAVVSLIAGYVKYFLFLT